MINKWTPTVLSVCTVVLSVCTVVLSVCTVVLSVFTVVLSVFTVILSVCTVIAGWSSQRDSASSLSVVTAVLRDYAPTFPPWHCAALKIHPADTNGSLTLQWLQEHTHTHSQRKGLWVPRVQWHLAISSTYTVDAILLFRAWIKLAFCKWLLVNL